MKSILGAVVLSLACCGVGVAASAHKPAVPHHKAAATLKAGGPVVALAIRDGTGHRKLVSLTDLRDMPQTEVAISQVTDKGMEEGKYSGVLLWSLIDKDTLAEKGAKNAKLRRTVAVIGRDGYWVTVSLGEIDPDYAGTQAVLALKKDGANLDAPRLVIPGDKHAGRSVSEVIALDVR